ncbi:MAG: hypothetical protein R6U37_02220 [Dehalococcoidia bacterium]
MVKTKIAYVRWFDELNSDVESNSLTEKIRDELDKLEEGRRPLRQTGADIRKLFLFLRVNSRFEAGQGLQNYRDSTSPRD